MTDTGKQKIEKIVETLILVSIFSLPFSKSAAEIGFIMSLFLWLAQKIIFREKRWLPFWLYAIYGGFLALTLFSILQAAPEELRDSLRGFLKWLKYISVFFMTADIFRNGTASRKLIYVFLVSCFLLSLNGFYQMVTGQDLLTHHSIDIPGRLVRMRSTLGSPNGLAAFYLFSIPLSFWVWLNEKYWSKIAFFSLIVCALSTVGLGLTLSRAAVFSLIMAALLFFLFKKNYRILLASIAVSALFLVSSPMVRDNFLNSLDVHDETIGERLSFWKTSWRMIQAQPFFGHGVNTYFQNFPKFAASDESYRGYAHNCYLQMWCEVGVFGLVLFLIPFVLIFSKYLFAKESKPKNFSREDALFIGTAAFLMQAFFDTHFYALQLAYLFWIFWAIFASQVLDKKNPPFPNERAGNLNHG